MYFIVFRFIKNSIDFLSEKYNEYFEIIFEIGIIFVSSVSAKF
jgi:hypothetical protein